jgi:hypothetical protein
VEQSVVIASHDDLLTKEGDRSLPFDARLRLRTSQYIRNIYGLTFNILTIFAIVYVSLGHVNLTVLSDLRKRLGLPVRRDQRFVAGKSVLTSTAKRWNYFGKLGDSLAMVLT